MLARWELALKRLGRAGGCTLEMALSWHEAAPIWPSSKGEFTAVSGRNLCPRWPSRQIRLSSAVGSTRYVRFR